MERVGVRELRQNASVLLDRIESTGVTIEITNHGRLVARLGPAGPAPGARSRAELIAAGALRPGRGDPLAVDPVVAPSGTPATQALLDADRDER